MRLSSPYSQSNNFFGYGEQGNFNSNGNFNLSIASNSNPTYVFYDNFTLNSGHTYTTTAPCRGLYIYVRGTATINGTISMTRRGIYSPPTGDYANGYTPLGMDHVLLYNDQYQTIKIPSTVTAKNTNAPANSGQCGGGSGNYSMSKVVKGSNSYAYGGSGGTSGIFSGGSGGGGCWIGDIGVHVVTLNGTNATNYGGAAGRGGATTDASNYNRWVMYGGAGAGNPGYSFTGTGTTSGSWVESATYTGTGGVLYLICNKLVINGGSLQSRGCAPYGSKSGGSGGGSITILYRELIGSISTNVSAVTRGYAGSTRTYHIA